MPKFKPCYLPQNNASYLRASTQVFNKICCVCRKPFNTRKGRKKMIQLDDDPRRWVCTQCSNQAMTEENQKC